MPHQRETADANGSREPHDHGDQLLAGVVGVGAMGQNHARLYDQLHDVDLVGVADADPDVAARVAETYDCRVHSREELLEAADLVSAAVPTTAHAGVVGECIDAGTHVLVEKPFVADIEEGRDLATRARDAGVLIQVGHVERFNPAVQVLPELLADLEVVAVDARRLGPPVEGERGVDESVVLDLMIHDLDVVTTLLDAEVATLAAFGSDDAGYATAVGRMKTGVTVSFTASRTTQRKVRRLGITARECQIEVDYAERRVELHRRSRPAFVTDDGGVRRRIESVVEHPMVRDGEPLRAELEAFVDAVKTGSEPVVTAEDGLQALALVRQIESLLDAPTTPGVGAS
jgi:predicted dehydrogenase